jgi:hypothetical protein
LKTRIWNLESSRYQQDKKILKAIALEGRKWHNTYCLDTDGDDLPFPAKVKRGHHAHRLIRRIFDSGEGTKIHKCCFLSL